MRVNGRTQRRGPGARDTRRVEGEARNAAWRALTPALQLLSLARRRGNSKRQTIKLEKTYGKTQS
jgi:hypothetical protein